MQNKCFPQRRRITPGHAFLLGALVALCALSPAILPYGGRYVTRGDFIEQQLPFILETRRILRAGLDSYSFNTLLGTPAVGSYAFYTLGSPFVWPLALLPEALIPFGISVMAVLKHAVCALCAFLFFRQVIREERLALLGSILYTFSSFTVVNTQFYHFTEVIAFFPLILYGLEIAMSAKPRPGLLALFCGLNALTNYYFMLGSALLAALYFAFRFFSRDWRGARTFRRVFFTVFECGVGCALAGVILLPALWFMLSITRTGAGDTSLLAMRYTPAVLLERLRVLLMPIESNVVHAYYGDAASWTSTACSLPAFGLTGAAVFLFAQKGERWLKSLLAALLAASCVPVLCGAFALFTNVAYTRWWYGLALMLTLATLYALKSIPSRRLWFVAFAACSAIVLAITVPFLLPEGMVSTLPERLAGMILNRRTGAYSSGAFRVLSLLLTLLGGGAMVLMLIKPACYKRALLAVCLTAALQYAGYIAVGDSQLLSGGSEVGKGVYELSEIAGPTLSSLDLPEPDGYERIDYSPMLRNYGLLRGQSSMTCFTSLRASVVGRFLSMAGMGYDESTTIMPSYKDPALYALLSAAEYHQWPQDEAMGDSVPEGFIYDREENGAAVYANPSAVPMGFLQTTYTGTHHQRMDRETVGTVMLAAAALGDTEMAQLGDNLSRMQKLDVYAIPDWQESAARLRENSCDSFTLTDDGFTAHINAKQAGLLVFTIPYDKGFSATVDAQKADVILCDVAFMGVWVEPGEHEIAFTYRTRGLALGTIMSAVAAVMIGIYVVLVRKKKLRIA